MLACSHDMDMGSGHAREHNRKGRLVTTAFGVILVLGGAACGGGGKPTATAVGQTVEATTTTTEVGAAYSACLRDHGVDLPGRPRQGQDGTGTPPSSRPQQSTVAGDPPPSRPPGSRPSTSLPAGVDQAKVTAAREACKSLLPADRGPGAGAQGQAFQAYTSCMKDHGVTVQAGGGPGGFGGGGGAGAAQRDDPAFKAADAICGVLRPTQP